MRRAYEQAKEDGKTVKIWRTAGDEKVRDSHAAMDGVAVGIDERFEVDGEALFLPSDPDASLDETANCRCTVEYEVAQAGAESGVGEDRPERPLKVDRSFIEDQEGGLRTRAYVPIEEGEVLGNSGVTIGAGVDLGQQTEEGLDALEIDPAVMEKITPYLGRRGQEALDYVRNKPLALSVAEARDLTDHVHDAIIRDMARRYNDDSDLDFYDLPREAQTVIADVAVQYGADLARPPEDGGAPRFWGFVTTGNWDAAVEELENFKDDYPNRRRAEAKLLDEARKAGSLP